MQGKREEGAGIKKGSGGGNARGDARSQVDTCGFLGPTIYLCLTRLIFSTLDGLSPHSARDRDLYSFALHALCLVFPSHTFQNIFSSS